MKLMNPRAEFFIPDNLPLEQALRRCTHMAISAHQDDIEIMAYDGILKCFGHSDQWFLGVVVTDGAGSPREGLYAGYTDEQMRQVRRLEQKKAAYVGEYGGLALLDYTSSQVKDPSDGRLALELAGIISKVAPRVIYTHNPADKHDTHVAVAVKVIKALRSLPKEVRPAKLYGCEVWRSLDWVNDEEKVVFDVSAHSNLAAALVEVYDSQINGGKRYDQATIGRRLANATYAAAHGADRASALIYGLELTELMNDPEAGISAFIQGYIRRFEEDVTTRIHKFE
ncbi:MAG: PIG-L family deacetylase [Firmicutes bacterium]|nr:PIG-L family deacetylase [Bacillota bacterium]